MKVLLGIVIAITLMPGQANAQTGPLEDLIQDVQRGERILKRQELFLNRQDMLASSLVRRAATQQAITKMSKNRELAYSVIENITLANMETLRQAEADAERDKRYQEVSNFMNLASASFGLVSAINSMATKMPPLDEQLNERPDPNAELPTSAEDVDNAFVTEPKKLDNSKIDRIQRNLKQLEELPVDWQSQPDFRLTKAEQLIRETYLELLSLEPSKLDLFALENRLTAFGVFKDVAGGASMNPLKRWGALLKIMARPQTVNDGGPGGQAAINWYFNELDKYYRRHWEWRARRPFPSVKDFNLIDEPSIEKFFECQEGCMVEQVRP